MDAARPDGGPNGQVAEWLKAADCKSARASVRWFESSPVHHLFLDRSARTFERGEFAQKRLFLFDCGAFATQEVGDGVAEACVG